MCGIAGSFNFDKAFDLYTKNLKRGSHSSGLLCVRDFKDPLVIKEEGIFNKDNLKFKYNLEDSSYFLFHSRAPTNSTKLEWSELTTHPFKYENYYVAHNGIITNFKELNKNYNLDIDSEIIPRLLFKDRLIKNVYSQLEGLLTSWIYNNNTQQINIVKAGSSLWMDGCSFSSVQFENAEQIEDDGYIFELENNKIFLKQTFEYINPYFI